VVGVPHPTLLALEYHQKMYNHLATSGVYDWASSLYFLRRLFSTFLVATLPFEQGGGGTDLGVWV